ncbi:hypothetical protein P43SY_000939 [Pythium insidiosum]|uniref:Protein kinase domain-containing protein n=1 Tax=Pythium insidiosum TaxID=114742 RepID=A0AAD5LCQ5_PYTIN|nr:hypothetical protein P43SY_000939 [Pythium insidiosum]
MQFAGGMTHTEDLVREEHNRRKEMERTELIHLILESIASVPMAVEKIHTNPKLRAALTQQMGEQHALLNRIFDGTDLEQERSAEGTAAEQIFWAEERPSGSFGLDASPTTMVLDADDNEESEDGSSAYDSEYENDLADAHLVRLIDYFYFREHLIIVTELLRDNLYEFSKLLADRGHANYFTIPRLKKVACQILEALEFLHSLGLVHCDLKPENILISNFNECRIKVIDFGSSCFVTDELTSYVQSRSYRAPEVILGLEYDQKIDMWSLGCVLAELFTGDVLFKNNSEQSLLERIIAAIGPVPSDLLQDQADLLIQFTENPPGPDSSDRSAAASALAPRDRQLPSAEEDTHGDGDGSQLGETVDASPAPRSTALYHDRWARYYPGMEVAVVTNIEKPPSPPEGYVPLRLGVHRQFDEPLLPEECDDMTGFSMDTLQWDAPLLEARLHELTTWMRRPTHGAMTTLLLHWLNEELHLHRRVEVLERDLSNGYVFAEVLSLHGFEDRLDRYSDLADVPTRIRNLELLGQAMAKAGLGELSMTIKRGVLMENRSIILQLLFRIKDFVQARRSTASQGPKDVPPRVYDPPPEKEDPFIRDVDERFVKECREAFRPTEIAFDRNVNMAVHLRKFPQTQWRAENALRDHQERLRADKAEQAANGMSAMRSHLKAKHDFMQDWDQERYEKWKETQRLQMLAERNDLRLELTLEERKRRFQAAKLCAEQADAADGVAFFERNMTRLGLDGPSSGAGAEPPLRAVPATDAGPLAHLQALEQRVGSLQFRPSNNVQMMKELRARRKAQLAAEKDRRIRRMKAMRASTPPTSSIAETNQRATATEQWMSQHDEDDEDDDSDDDERRETTTGFSAHEQFLQTKKEELEANYARLHDIGVVRRERDLEALSGIRAQRRLRSTAEHEAVCRELIASIASFAITVSEQRLVSDSPEWLALRQSYWHAPFRVISPIVDDTEDGDLGSRDVMRRFLGLTGVWSRFAPLHKDRSLAFDLERRLEVFAERVAALAVDCDALSLSPTATGDGALTTVAVFTADERCARLARSFAAAQALLFIDVDELVEECIQHSYDPQKQADHAASLAPRERTLGAFGPRLSALRQKSTPVPDAQVVEIVIAVMQLAKRSDNSAEEPSERNENETARPAPRAWAGYLLHNFPRTLEEAKCLEKALVATLDIEEDAKTQRLAALEAALANDEPAPNSLVSRVPPEVPDVPAPPTSAPFFSSIDLLLVIKPWTPPQEQPSRSGTPVETDPAIAVSDRPSRASVAKIDPELEASRRREALVQVERFVGRTSRCVTVDQLERVPDSVILEMSYLALQVYAMDPAHRHLVGAVRCETSVSLPREMALAREQRRQEMTAEERLAWMLATQELTLHANALTLLGDRVRARFKQLQEALCRQFGRLEDVLAATSVALWAAQEQLDGILQQRGDDFQATIDAALCRVSRKGATDKERLWTDVEVSLGDIVECQRLAANAFLQDQAEKSSLELLAVLRRWIAVLPLVVLELREHAQDVLDLLQNGLYSHVPFLACAFPAAFSVAARLADLTTAVSTLEAFCEPPVVALPGIGDEIQRLLSPITALCVGAEDEFASLPSSSYELHQQRVTAALTGVTLDRVIALLGVANDLFTAAIATGQRQREELQQYVKNDLRWKSELIAATMARLRASQQARWPVVAPLAPRLSDPSQRLTTHHRSQFLSVPQVVQWIRRLRSSGPTPHQKTAILKTEDVIAATLEVARTHSFPHQWLDATAVASLAMRWSLGDRVAWQTLVFAVVSRQFGVPLPSVDAIETLLSTAARESKSDSDRWHVSVQELGRLPLWFVDTDIARDYRLLMSELFRTGSEDTHSVDLTALVLTLCAAPALSEDPYAFATSVVFPEDDKGLRRAVQVLKRWPEVDGAPALGQAPLRVLCEFVGVDWDANKAEQISADESRLLLSSDLDGFVEICRAFDRALVFRLALHEPFRALVDGS